MKTENLMIFKGIEKEVVRDKENLRIAMSEKTFSRNETVLYAGDMTKKIGIVMSGSVNIENHDLWGNRSILNNVGPGHVFAETYALCKEPMMVDVVAAEDTVVLFVDLHIMFSRENMTKEWYPGFVRNMLYISMEKNLQLTNRIFCTSSKTIRGRVLTYLSNQSIQNNASQFNIPFDRQQMADYLNLDRSALSKELRKMKDDGLIDFHKNSFKLLIR